ncbi:MAG TPA: helix-turn-helix transcriptional regulator [Thermoleophilaceae bacterium]|jgi:transcriptional regulator with XRE-family HTH domain
MPRRNRKLGRFIAARRKERGLSLARLAEQIGTTKSNVHAWEAGEWIPKATLLEPLAQALGVSYEDLFALAGYAHPDGLPAFEPYLRAKYGALPEDALAEAEAFFDELTERYGGKEGDAEPGR